MSDRLYLSYRIQGFDASTMPRHYEKLLRLFPFSRLAETSSVLRIHPIDDTEPLLLEQAFPHPVDLEEVLKSCREFAGGDCACRLETLWDLWQFDGAPDAAGRGSMEGGWKLAPARIALACFGPEFAGDPGDQLRVDFGLETQFLPEPETGKSLSMVRSNIRSLLHFVHEADDRLAVKDRRLWSESGGNFAARLQASLEDAV
ncbi:MAG: hypothetical protein ABI165_04290 [Bryobacteraceae bacterium]